MVSRPPSPAYPNPVTPQRHTREGEARPATPRLIANRTDTNPPPLTLGDRAIAIEEISRPSPSGDTTHHAPPPEHGTMTPLRPADILKAGPVNAEQSREKPETPHARTEGSVAGDTTTGTTTQMRKRRRVIEDVSGELNGAEIRAVPHEPAPLAPRYEPMDIDDEGYLIAHLPEGDEGENDTYRMLYCHGINPHTLTKANMPPPVPNIENRPPNPGRRQWLHDDLFGPRALATLEGPLRTTTLAPPNTAQVTTVGAGDQTEPQMAHFRPIPSPTHPETLSAFALERRRTIVTVEAQLKDFAPPLFQMTPRADHPPSPNSRPQDTHPTVVHQSGRQTRREGLVSQMYGTPAEPQRMTPQLPVRSIPQPPRTRTTRPGRAIFTEPSRAANLHAHSLPSQAARLNPLGTHATATVRAPLRSLPSQAGYHFFDLDRIYSGNAQMHPEDARDGTTTMAGTAGRPVVPRPDTPINAVFPHTSNVRSRPSGVQVHPAATTAAARPLQTRGNAAHATRSIAPMPAPRVPTHAVHIHPQPIYPAPRAALGLTHAPGHANPLIGLPPTAQSPPPPPPLAPTEFTPTPNGGWRPIQGSDPFWKRANQDEAQAEEWRLTEGGSVLVGFFGHGALDPGAHTDRAEAQLVIRRFLTSKAARVHLPTPKVKQRVSNSSPFLTLVNNITKTDAERLLEQMVLSTRKITLLFVRNDLDPPTLLTAFKDVHAFGVETDEQRTSIFVTAFLELSDAIYQLITVDIANEGRWFGYTAEDAFWTVISSVRVETSVVGN